MCVCVCVCASSGSVCVCVCVLPLPGGLALTCTVLHLPVFDMVSSLRNLECIAAVPYCVPF